MTSKNSADDKPDVQLIANIVIMNADGQTLLTKYDSEDERWWLPGAQLNTYEHPDKAAARALAGLAGLRAGTPRLHHIESFRGRRGWHVMFNYTSVAIAGEAAEQSQWFAPDKLPATMHGKWEAGVLAAVRKSDPTAQT
jgi:ADP-ribose pyrophosphatase YjhB (NUDIX family)